MRSFAIAAVIGLAAAAPRPQADLPWDAIDAVEVAPATAAPMAPTTTSAAVDATSLASSIASSIATEIATAGVNQKRDLEARSTSTATYPATCTPQPTGSGPATSPDTADAFLANSVLSSSAAAAPTPYGYTTTFVNKDATVNLNSYLKYKTLTSYDPYACQEFCDATQGCYGFNLYFERDPTVDPAVAACANPPSTNTIKCSLYGGPLPSADTTGVWNDGQWRGPADSNGVTFHVVIAGSNGYVKDSIPAAPSGFQSAVVLPGAINAPSGYIGSKFISTVGWSADPSYCATACTQTTAYNSRHPDSTGAYNSCNFFNMYVLSENGVATGLTCSMYTSSWGASYATNLGQTRGSDRYTVSDSYGFSIAA